MINKLVLGSANFGFKYGLSNQKFNQDQINNILSLLRFYKLKFIDTARSYGDSELKIGNYIKEYRNNFNIISKFSVGNNNNINNLVKNSLKNLNTTKLYGFLFHDFNEYIKNPEVYLSLIKNKKLGYIKKIGFSLYYPHQLEYLFKNKIEFDIVQFPYNVFDKRFEYLFPILKKNNIEIHARSIFLQGLVFMNEKIIPNKLINALPSIYKLNSISNKLNFSILESCLYYVVYNKFIDKIVLGVDSKNHLKEICSVLIKKNNLKNKIDKLNKLGISDEKIILPFNWN